MKVIRDQARVERGSETRTLGRLTVMVKAVLGWAVLSAMGQGVMQITGLMRRIFTTIWRFLVLVHYTGDRDFNGLMRLLKSKYLIWKCRRHNYKVHDLFEMQVKKHPDKLCLISHEQQWTFKEVNEYANRIGNCFSELGYMAGEEVALFMEGSPHYVAIWLGLSKIGVIPALVNTNQRLEPLVHSFTSVQSKAVIFGSEMQDAIREVEGQVKEGANISLFFVGELTPGSVTVAQSLDALLLEASPEKPLSTHVGKFTDRLFYVYTSGTTGLPKAAIITHSRFIWMCSAIHNMLQMTHQDIVYTCLPLYHTASGILAVGQTMVFGNTLAIRKKFSASKFWEDCILFNATVSHYIGEICRYLLATKPSASDQQHKVRLMFGNGLRQQIWTPFMERFNIKQIGELYGSTEGNANVINIDNTVGSVGFISQIAPAVYPVSLIRMDENSGEPIRNEKGLCVICKPGEAGEFVGKIQHQDPVRAFDGYVNKTATAKKVITDVFRKGDSAFLSGDLLTMDWKGYLYFMDRTGDTFRWKGENVSTTEVEGIISKVLRLSDCVVYGVEVKGMEGKAGMVAIPDKSGRNNFDLKTFTEELRKILPPYAVPLFIRIVKELESTGTYKLKKVELQRQGFSPITVSDLMFYLDPKIGYKELTMEAYDGILSGNIRL